MPNELLDDIEFKARNGAQISINEAEGIVECFVSGIGNKDSVGDIVLPGAFNESLKRRKPRVVWGHSWNDPIGKVLEIYEVPSSDPRLPQKMKKAGIGGLFAKVQFNLNAEKGREAFANVAFFGEEQEWSIGYKTLQANFDPVQQANMLKEVELYEVSPVLHGANQLTGTISVKDGEEGACGPNSCECGTKNHISAEPDVQTEEEEVLIFEKGQMMGRVPMRMIIVPMPKKPSGDSDDDASTRDIWSRGEAGPIDAEKRMELAKEIHSRTKVPIKILEATENMVVFLRKMVDGTDRMYRMGYHRTDSGKYMFGKPARVKPQMMYAPVKPTAPVSPMGPMSVKPNINPIQGKDTDEVKTDPFLIPCEIEQVFEVKETLEPIIEHYGVKVTPSAGGLICSDYPPDFREAADTAIKALGGKLGRGGGLGKARRAGRALTASFDPKAWDGDNDGLVQEGTPFQRPAVPGINTNLPGRGMRSSRGVLPSERTFGLPSKEIRNMPVKEREGRMADINQKIDWLDNELDILQDPDVLENPDVLEEYGDKAGIKAAIAEIRSRRSELTSEHRKHQDAATIYSWENGSSSRIQLPEETKSIELELTPDEVDSLRSHIKGMVDGSRNEKANAVLARYSQLLEKNKNGVVKIPAENYNEIVENWDLIDPPTRSRVHGKTGRDILEFAALSTDKKYRSDNLDLPEDKYRGFSPTRINNGAPPEINPALQKAILKAGENGSKGVWLRGSHDMMVKDLVENRSGSPRRWAVIQGRYTHATSQGIDLTDRPQADRSQRLEGPSGSRRANMGGRRANLGRGGRTARQSASGSQALRARPNDRDALFDEPFEDPVDDYDMLPDYDFRARDTVTRMEGGMRSARRNNRTGMRSERRAESTRETRDIGKRTQAGRPMGTEQEGDKRFIGKTFDEVKPKNWDDLSTEDKFSLLNAELSPSRSGMRSIDFNRIYAELDKILERKERRRQRREGNFESLEDRRARRVIQTPRRIREREERANEPPARRTAQSAKATRKQDRKKLENSFVRADAFATTGREADEVRDEHSDVWNEAIDIINESDDLTFSQLEALDSLFEDYLGRDPGDLTETEGELRSAAVSQKTRIEDLISDYTGDNFIQQGDTASIRRIGSDTGDNDIMESGDLPDLFSSGGMRMTRQFRNSFPSRAPEEYINARRRQGMRSQRERSREGRIADLRNLYRNAEATGDSAEMDRLERQLRDLNAGPPVRRRTPTVGRARPNDRQSQGGNFRNTGERGGMRSERAGRTQITGEATWFKKIENSLQKEIDMARNDDDRKTVDALRTLKRTLERQESGKTGDRRTNVGTLTVTQAEIDEMLDALMHVLDRQVDTDGSRTELFAELIEKLSSAAMSTFIMRDTDEIQSRTRDVTNQEGRTVSIPNTEM